MLSNCSYAGLVADIPNYQGKVIGECSLKMIVIGYKYILLSLHKMLVFRLCFGVSQELMRIMRIGQAPFKGEIYW